MQIRKQSSFNTNPTTSTPTTSSSSLLDPNSRQLVDSLANRLRRRQCKGSFRTALETLILVRNLLSAIKPAQQPRVDDWVRLVAEAGKRLTAAQPTELAVSNVIGRVIHLIREEYAAMDQEGKLPNPSSSSFTRHNNDDNDEDDDDDNDEEIDDKKLKSSSSSLLMQDSNMTATPLNLSLSAEAAANALKTSTISTAITPNTPTVIPTTTPAVEVDKKLHHLKPIVIEGIREIMDEIESSHLNIAAQALEHIHSNEIILTMGMSKTVECFLKTAAKRRKFQVIVVETAPMYEGHEMARSLGAAGIDTTLITDSAVFAIMSRVNKVILGTHAVTANGGLVATTGTANVALAAKYHSTPVVVTAGLYKMSQKYPYDTAEFTALASPDAVYEFGGRASSTPIAAAAVACVDFVNPGLDFVRPELVAVFITNVGPHPPSYICHLINESYSLEDNV